MSLKQAAKDLLAIAKNNIKGRRYDAAGLYYPDPTPIAPPVGYVRSPTIAEQIRTMVRSESLRAHADAQGVDTFEEADDFAIGDDYDPRSPWEEQFDGEFSQPLNQEVVPRDPTDRNPATPPGPAKAGDAPGGGSPPASSPAAPAAAPAPPAAAPASK